MKFRPCGRGLERFHRAYVPTRRHTGRTHKDQHPRGARSMSDAAVEQMDQSRAKVFISYSRKDIAFADRLEAALKARGFEPLIDRTDIYAFENASRRWSRARTVSSSFSALMQSRPK